MLRGRKCPESALDDVREAYALVFEAAERACLEALDLRLDGNVRFDGWIETAKRLFEKYLGPVIAKNIFAMLNRAAFAINDNVDESLKSVPTVKAHRYLAAGDRKLKEFLETNRRLIISVGDATVERLGKLISSNPDLHSSALRPMIQKSLGQSKRRADLWARDQTLKLHANVVKEKHTSLGITEYFWRTSEDERVRDDPKNGDHDSLNGNRYKYSDPPIVALKGMRRCNPGEDYECRCTADPILPD